MANDRPAPETKRQAEPELSPGVRSVMSGLGTATLVLAVWLPAALSAIVLLLGIANQNAGQIWLAIVGGLLAGFMWLITKGMRDAAKDK